MNVQEEEARLNLVEFRRNPYNGRYVAVGMTDAGERVVVYGAESRTPENRWRRFDDLGNGTIKVNPSREGIVVQHPDLVYYDAMLEHDGFYVVGNGSHNRHGKAGDLGEVIGNMLSEGPEPDSLKTPRIMAVLNMRGNGPQLMVIIVKSNPFNKTAIHEIYSYQELTPGRGILIHTYGSHEDGATPPSFTGNPRPIIIEENPIHLLEQFSGYSDPRYRIATVVKTISPTGKSNSIIYNECDVAA